MKKILHQAFLSVAFLLTLILFVMNTVMYVFSNKNDQNKKSLIFYSSNMNNFLILKNKYFHKNINLLNEQGDTVLTKNIIDKADYRYISMIIKSGADPNLKNSFGWSPIMLATAYYNDSNLIKVLIKSHANLNEFYNSLQNGKFNLIDIAAIYSNSPKTVEYMLKISSKKHYDTSKSLILASEFNKNKEVVSLLANKLNKYINEIDEYGETALVKAIKYNKDENISHIIMLSGGDINSKDHNYSNREELIKEYVSYASDIKVFSELMKHGGKPEGKKETEDIILSSIENSNNSKFVHDILIYAKKEGDLDSYSKEHIKQVALHTHRYENLVREIF